jgi:hypothetical protein
MERRAVDRGLADLQARFNVLSVRREELARRFPGSFTLGGGPPDALGVRAPPGLHGEWERVGEDLRRVEEALQKALAAAAEQRKPA